MNYSYILNEKDLKEACFQSVYALNHYKKRRLFISLIYPLLMYLTLLFSDSFVTKTFFYFILVLFLYFYYYQYLLYKTKKRDLSIKKEWQGSFSAEATEECLSVFYNGIDKKIDWEEIVAFSETKNNIILYLSPRTLDFIILKKETGAHEKESREFYSLVRKKVNKN